jgi:hypothetical protein
MIDLLFWKKLNLVDFLNQKRRHVNPPTEQNNALLGARLAHFEVFLHEAPPRWRLKVEKIFFYEAFFETESQEKLNQIH